MQRPATVRLRTQPLRGRRPRSSSASTPSDSRSTTSPAASPPRAASSSAPTPRSAHTTFRDHLTRVRMERAAELLAHGAADRARGRAPRRLPPAGAVRQGVPPPPRRRAVGLPRRARGARAAARAQRSPPRRARERRGRRSHGLRSVVGTCVGCRLRWAARRAACATGPRRARRAPASSQMLADRRRSRRRSASPSALLIDWFPAEPPKQAKPIDTLWDVLMIVSVPVFVLVETIVLYSRLEVPHAAGRGARGRPADPRQHAARDHLDRDPGDHPRRALHLRLRRADATSRRPRPTR